MTDEERDQYFDMMKRRTAIALLGIDPEAPETKARAVKAYEVEVRVVNKEWDNPEEVSWMYKTRITDPMNADLEDISAYIAKKNARRRMLDPYRGWKLASHED